MWLTIVNIQKLKPYEIGKTRQPGQYFTTKVDIAARYVCRLLNYMDTKGIASVTPRAPKGQLDEGNVMSSLSSGYVQRDIDELPRQGRSGLWRVTHAYEVDKAPLLDDTIDDGVLEFARIRQTASFAAASITAAA